MIQWIILGLNCWLPPAASTKSILKLQEIPLRGKKSHCLFYFKPVAVIFHRKKSRNVSMLCEVSHSSFTFNCHWQLNCYFVATVQSPTQLEQSVPYKPEAYRDQMHGVHLKRVNRAPPRARRREIPFEREKESLLFLLQLL